MGMPRLERTAENPVLVPDVDQAWQSYAAFNPSVVKVGDRLRLVYRAMSAPRLHEGVRMSVSSIGIACGDAPVHFPHTEQFIRPTESWDRFGCEDPRVTLLDDTYFIFYTALSAYPFDAASIRVGVALSRDLRTVDEKHLVTPFNAKAMALFPRTINGKYAAILTVDTDRPPAKLALAFFDSPRQIWSEDYWNRWYASLPDHVIPLLRSRNDHIEVGAAPVWTEKGWLLVHSYIRNYFSAARQFGVEAVLLDAADPFKVVGRTPEPLMVPARSYELEGDVPDVIFPSGAILEDDKLRIYYGAADTVGCTATVDIAELLDCMCAPRPTRFVESHHAPNSFLRYADNPLIAPRPELTWEAQSAFNPAAIREDGQVHLLYRAMSREGVSVFGYARSTDGVHIALRARRPVYEPRELFEKAARPGNSGCEDPRLTTMGDRIYLFYTAYDGILPRVAFSSIARDDFLAMNWRWERPKVISPPNVADKDACVFPEKVNGKFAILHRPGSDMYIDYVDSMDFGKDDYLHGLSSVVRPEKEYCGLKRFGIAAPPLKTERGWLLLFHYVSEPGSTYRVEALLLDRDDPAHVLAETAGTLLQPEMDYEKTGDVANVVFPCGAVLMDGHVYLYYGGGDKVACVARMSLQAIYRQMGL